MSAAADIYLVERRPLLERLRSSVARLARHRAFLPGTAVAGLLATSAVTLATGSHDPLTLALRLAPLVGVGVAAGLCLRRISSDARELQATTALRRALLDSTVDGICLTDTAGGLMLANAPLQRFALELGLPPSDTVTESLLALADRTTEPARFRERMQALAHDQAPSEDEFELADSGRVFRGYTAPIARPDGTVVARI
jgi:PAS domain-containing protein